MKYLFRLICLFVAQKSGDFDRWLCANLHWSLRLHWHALWVRQDKFHPSLSSNKAALYDKKRFFRKLLKLWFDIKRCRPIPTKSDNAEETAMIEDFIDRIDKKYHKCLDERRLVARRRDNETPSAS